MGNALPSLGGSWSLTGLAAGWKLTQLTLGELGGKVFGGLEIEIDEGPWSFTVMGMHAHPAVHLLFDGSEPFVFRKISFQFIGRFTDPNTAQGALSGGLSGPSTLSRIVS